MDHPTRRQFLHATLGVSSLALAGCGRHVASEQFPGTLQDFERIVNLPLPTLRIGPENGRAVVVLHELPGLTKDDLALGRALKNEGFRAYFPILFGEPEDDNLLVSFQRACGGKDPFNCSDLSARSPILDKLAPLCEQVAGETKHPIGAIGMCLTGILPLALLPHGVDAAVLCQPTLPFSSIRRKPNKEQAPDLGLGASDLANAQKSTVHFMLVHYVGDELCPAERVEQIHRTFDARVATIDLKGDHHSSLASDFDMTAFTDVVSYMKVRLAVEQGPRPMKVAQVKGRPCAIGADRTWQTT